MQTHTQQESSGLNDLASTIGLKSNVAKTNVMSNDPDKEAILINNQSLEYVDKIASLGSVMLTCMVGLKKTSQDLHLPVRDQYGNLAPTAVRPNDRLHKSYVLSDSASPGMDSRGTKEKGATTNNMEENDTGRDEEHWHWVGERHKISPGQGGLVGPCRGFCATGPRMSE
ncbi:hypothetical protein ACROYT_G010806 [Oculina patagonica]